MAYNGTTVVDMDCHIREYQDLDRTFRDNIDRAHASGVDYVVQPGGAMHEQDIISACDEYGMAMVCTGLRLFHH